MGDARRLFSDGDLASFLEERRRRLLSEVDGFEEEYILNAAVEDLCHHLVGKYSLAPLVLGQVEAEVSDLPYDAAKDPQRYVSDRSRPCLIPGTQVAFAVAYEGDAALLRYRPSSFSSGAPLAQVVGSVLRLAFHGAEQDPAWFRARFEEQHGLTQQYVGWVAKDVEDFNVALGGLARRHIAARRGKLLADRNMAQSLGYPLRRRKGDAATYPVPLRPTAPRIRLPPASTAPFRPEPELEMEEYERILAILANTALVIERNPSSFTRMDEQTLRDHCLLQLNGHYEGQATGETFNSGGKTDILVRVEGRNVFIAECKIWDGPAKLADAIDQLLGYTSWRDTKTAVLLFNRQKEFSQVLAKTPGVVRDHPSYKRQQNYRSETGFRFVLGHRDDPARELVLTVLAFQVSE